MAIRIRVTESYYPHEQDATERKLADIIVEELDLALLLQQIGSNSVRVTAAREWKERMEKPGKPAPALDPIRESVRIREGRVERVRHFDDLPEAGALGRGGSTATPHDPLCASQRMLRDGERVRPPCDCHDFASKSSPQADGADKPVLFR